MAKQPKADDDNTYAARDHTVLNDLVGDLTNQVTKLTALVEGAFGGKQPKVTPARRAKGITSKAQHSVALAQHEKVVSMMETARARERAKQD